MNLTALLASIQAKGYPSDAASVAWQTIALNSVYRTICGSDRWPFMEKQDASLSTTINVPGYDISSIASWLFLDAVRIEDDVALQYYNIDYCEPQEFRDLENVDRDYATPEYWTFINQQLRFYPVPDQTYTIRIDYIAQPADLAAGSDVPVIPVIYHDLLVWGAIAEIAYRERDWLGRQFAQQEQQLRYKQMQEEYLLRQRQTSSHVKKSGWWGSQNAYPYAKMGW